MILLMNILRDISGMMVASPMFFVLLALGIVLYRKNKKVMCMQNIICGGSVNSTIELTLSQIILGIIGGCIASLMLGAMGVVFKNTYTIILLFFASIMLFKIKPRLICFSYSGAIVGIVSIIIKILNNFQMNFEMQNYFIVDIVELMTFVGVMHVIEGILVMIDGDRGAIPIFAEKNGEVFGGYSLRRYWIIPVIIITLLSTGNSRLTSEIIYDIPQWWSNMPYLGRLLLGSGIGLMLMNFVGVVGYSSVTFTKTKRQKAISSGIFILLFGIILIIVAQLARYGLFQELIVVIFAPVAHELMLNIQSIEEVRKEPKFRSNKSGLIILEIAENSVLKEMGVKIGNKIISINNQIVDSEQEIYKVLKENLYNAVIDISDSSGNIKQIKFRHKKNSRLGVVLVPKSVKKEDVIEVQPDSFNNILEEIRKKQSK